MHHYSFIRFQLLIRHTSLTRQPSKLLCMPDIPTLTAKVVFLKKHQ